MANSSLYVVLSLSQLLIHGRRWSETVAIFVTNFDVSPTSIGPDAYRYTKRCVHMHDESHSNKFQPERESGEFFTQRARRRFSIRNSFPAFDRRWFSHWTTIQCRVLKVRAADWRQKWKLAANYSCRLAARASTPSEFSHFMTCPLTRLIIIRMPCAPHLIAGETLLVCVLLAAATVSWY